MNPEEKLDLVEDAAKLAAQIKRIDRALELVNNQEAPKLDLLILDGDGEHGPPESFFLIGYGDRVNAERFPHFSCVSELAFRRVVRDFLKAERNRLLEEFEELTRRVGEAGR
tara:strand:- start:579 stop:914 length:336 start_codon:yes stop_codon:yes gene_type:complete